MLERKEELYGVSVIMPVYNSEQYLEKAIDSVLAQDFDRFELILVDDGSTDDSGKICDRYAEDDRRVRVLHRENGGVCAARNAGINAARGEYIAFCDCDDEYLPGLLSDNYALAKEHDVDIMRYAKVKRMIRSDKSYREVIYEIKDMFIDRSEFAANYGNIRKEDTVWTALYRAGLIKKSGVRFDSRFYYGSEDKNFNLKLLLHAERLGFNSKAYYRWSQRDYHSTSRSFHDDHLVADRSLNLPLEYRFFSETCEGKVDNFDKNLFLLNSYVVYYVQYLSRSMTYTQAEKAEELEKLRNCKMFDEELPEETRTRMRAYNKRMSVSLNLFYERKYKQLLFVLEKGTALLDVFRFKKKGV